MNGELKQEIAEDKIINNVEVENKALKNNIKDTLHERRKHERYKIDNIEIVAKMALAKSVKIHDISLGGLSFEADRRLNIGNEYSLTIENNGEVLTIKGMIVWSSLINSKDDKGNTIPIYKVGMKCKDIFQEKLHKIIVLKNIEVQHRQTVEGEQIFNLNIKSLNLDNKDIERIENFVSSIYSR